MITIRYLSEGPDRGQWDAYVGPRASSVTDLFAWRRVVRDTYDMATHFLLATKGGQTVGALALFEVRHPLFGHSLATAAFGTDGGLHYDCVATRDALIAEARQLAVRLQVAYLVIRTRGFELDGFHHERRYLTSVINLAATSELAWTRLPAKTRNQVRHGMREGFQLASGPEQVEAFHAVFHQHMRDLGSPAHGLPFYRSILRHLGDRAEFFVVRDGSALVAGALLMWTNETAMNLHTVSLRRFNRRCPNYFLYWKMIEGSIAQGLKYFDMGRSEAGSSQLRFKENWAPREVDLCYNYFLVKARDVPQRSPRDPKYRFAIASWRRLPLFVTHALGPLIISGIA